jgi:hypothetical protein
VIGPVHIWVRETLDWAGEEAVRPKFRPRVELWNATFNMSFHAFRHRVREIATLNHSKVAGAICAGWDEIPDGALVLPVDDDDWFSPDVARMLASEFDPHAVGYYWTSSWVEVPLTFGHRIYLIKRRLLPWTRPKYVFTTNNYAMFKSEGAKPLLHTHTDASQWFERRLERPDHGPVKKIDRRLSLANRTLGSQTSLRFSKPSMSRTQLVRRFRRYRRLYDRPIHSELSWSRPYLEMMSVLMGELEVRDPR